ncbi:MAG: hypothetical protein ACT4N8_06715 [Sphingosinicella sp.]|uniref:hypothetical protein n=1 Tax=Sphingosinicella sp. TaxID=1917971 RepID=UPI004038393F
MILASSGLPFSEAGLRPPLPATSSGAPEIVPVDAPLDGRLKPFRASKRAEDTAVGCRANAAADLVRAAASGREYFRHRLEHSAAVWTARAELLERLARKLAARMAHRPAAPLTPA